MFWWDWLLLFLLVPWFHLSRWLVRLIVFGVVAKGAGKQIEKIKEVFKSGGSV